VDLLLQSGADVSVSDLEGWQAIHYSSHCSQVLCANVLMRCGANPTAESVIGETAMDLALIPEMLSVLKKDGTFSGLSLDDVQQDRIPPRLAKAIGFRVKSFPVANQ